MLDCGPDAWRAQLSAGESVEGGLANLCLLVRRGRYAALGQNWAALLEAMRADSALLAERLEGAQPCWDRPLAI